MKVWLKKPFLYLYEYETNLDTREQVVIQEFADALLVIPKTLTVNAAKDSSELVAKLRSSHSKSQRKGNENTQLSHTGLDLVKGEIRNNLVAGVVEPAISKIKSLRFATEAAITILRIDGKFKLFFTVTYESFCTNLSQIIFVIVSY